MHKKPRVELLLEDSYVSAILKSEKARLFQNLFARVDGKHCDILAGGELSCAFFVSSILLLFGLIRRKHANVDSTVAAMRRVGWREIAKPRRGAVVVWGLHTVTKGEPHKHIGFCLGAGEALSNSYFKKVPIRHPLLSKRLGAVEAYYWHPSLLSRKSQT